MSMKIGVISDTHDLLRTEITANLHGCDCILHGGDVSCRKILDQLKAIAPVKIVRGNNDGDWAEDLPDFMDFEAGGLRICMAHKKKDLPKNLCPYDLAVFGHTHQYTSDWMEHKGQTGRTLLLNPGSCGPRRLFQPITMAIVQIEGDRFAVERVEIHQAQKGPLFQINKEDIRKQIEVVIRETQRGMTTDAVAGKYGLDPKLTEQIARLYVTHPGVTADAIMTKMGL